MQYTSHALLIAGINNGLLGLAYSGLTSAFPGTDLRDDHPDINNVYYDPFFTTAVKNQLVSAPCE